MDRLGDESPARGAAPNASHVVVIMMENKEDTDVLGNSSAPYENALARRYGVAAESFAITHPSLPELSCADEWLHPRDHVRLHELHGGRHEHRRPTGERRRLVEGVSRGLSGFVLHRRDRRSVRETPRPVHLLPGRRRQSLPLLTPHGIRGAERGPPRAQPADVRVDLAESLQRHPRLRCRHGRRLPRANGSAVLAELGPAGFLVLTWDEGSSNAGCCGGAASGGHVATIVAGPTVRPAARERAAVDTYGVLATIERALGLAPLGEASNTRNGSLLALFKAFPGFADPRDVSGRPAAGDRRARDGCSCAATTRSTRSGWRACSCRPCDATSREGLRA